MEDYKPLHNSTIEDTTQLFKALSDPTRLRILHLLYTKECSVNEIAQTLQLQQSTVSHQLRLLKQRRLITYRREKTTYFYKPDDEHVMKLIKQSIDHVNHN